NLGLVPEAPGGDQRAAGAAALMIDVRSSFAAPLSEEMLLSWHRMIMQGHRHVAAGRWRTHVESMQVVSGPIGRERMHFEAPLSVQVLEEMQRYIQWFNDTAPGGKHEIKKAAVRSAIAHLYFESIHPFEDGNGRIGRAIAEKALSQGIGRPVLLSLSKTIEQKKKAYYQALEKAQRSNEITTWVNYFVKTILAAQAEAGEEISFTLRKTKFFDRYKHLLNERQLKVIKRLLEEGPKGFDGGLHAGKYGSMTKVSKATATRDL